jgi:hypothetical protein
MPVGHDPLLTGRLEGDIETQRGACYDYMFYMFNEEAFLSCFLAHDDHPFSAGSRRAVFLSILAFFFWLTKQMMEEGCSYLLLSTSIVATNVIFYQLGHCFCLGRYAGKIKDRISVAGDVMLLLLCLVCWVLFVISVLHVRSMDSVDGRFAYVTFFLFGAMYSVPLGIVKDTIVFAVLYLSQCVCLPDSDSGSLHCECLPDDDADDSQLTSAELFANLHAVNQKRRKSRPSLGSPPSPISPPSKPPAESAAGAAAPASPTRKTPPISKAKQQYLAPDVIPNTVAVGDSLYVETRKHGFVRCIVEAKGASGGSVNFGEEAPTEENHYMDDVIYTVFGVCVKKEKLEKGFHERTTRWEQKLETLLKGKVFFTENYVFDLFYYLFNKVRACILHTKYASVLTPLFIFLSVFLLCSLSPPRTTS